MDRAPPRPAAARRAGGAGADGGDRGAIPPMASAKLPASSRFEQAGRRPPRRSVRFPAGCSRSARLRRVVVAISRTITGALEQAPPAARTRSPAMISNWSPLRRTRIGWMMPFTRIDCASSSSGPCWICRRGCRGLGTMRSRSTSSGTPRGAAGTGGGATAASAGASGIRALRPRPSAGRFSATQTSLQQRDRTIHQPA